MLINLLILIVGLIVLVVGSHFFVKSAASISKKFGVPEFIIGLTLIAFGTSLPEFVSSIFASLNRESGLVIGNIIGANIANIALILGVASIITKIKIKRDVLEREGYFLLFVSVLLFIIALNNIISRIEGIILLVIFFAYTIFLFEVKPGKGQYNFREFLNYFFRFKYILTVKSRLVSNFNNKKVSSVQKKKVKRLFNIGVVKDFVVLVLGGFAIIFGAKYLVQEAIFFANEFNILPVVIGVLIALGTTMPEMSVAITAARKGLGNIVLGNSIGSCITNSLLILGVAAIIFPLSITNLTVSFLIPSMIFLSILLIVFIKSNLEIRKFEGIIFLILYALFLFLLLSGKFQ